MDAVSATLDMLYFGCGMCSAFSQTSDATPLLQSLHKPRHDVVSKLVLYHNEMQRWVGGILDFTSSTASFYHVLGATHSSSADECTAINRALQMWRH
jgi:hypothetical protein